MSADAMPLDDTVNQATTNLALENVVNKATDGEAMVPAVLGLTGKPKRAIIQAIFETGVPLFGFADGDLELVIAKLNE
eukprot:1196021-Prymnesium_polylepis.1